MPMEIDFSQKVQEVTKKQTQRPMILGLAVEQLDQIFVSSPGI